MLWYHKTLNEKILDELYQFCYNFFKGIDITTEVNPKCEIFQIYGIIRYLNPDTIVPLDILMGTFE